MSFELASKTTTEKPAKLFPSLIPTLLNFTSKLRSYQVFQYLVGERFLLMGLAVKTQLEKKRHN